MKHVRTPQRILLIAIAVSLVCCLFAEAKKGGNGGGKNEPFDPAWVVIEDGQLRLMASNGFDSQRVGKGEAFRRLSAPAWSPDGNWIAYMKAPNILMVRPDGTDNQLLAAFTTSDDSLPVKSYGLQWVPGEVDRIIYRGRDADIYILSTQTPGPPQPLGLICSGTTLSPDLDLETTNYQGALAYIDWFSGNLVVVRAEDGPSGMEVDLEGAVELSSLTKVQSHPSWSNDGLEIAFVYGDREDYSLKVLPILVTADAITPFEDSLRTLAYNDFAQGIMHVRWSPDDAWIAYIAQVGAEPGGLSALNLFHVDSSGQSLPVNVTGGEGRQTAVDWDPLWVNDIESP